jgi:chromosome partitioning protein
MTRVIAIANNKGGVGKTTTAANLAFGLATKLGEGGRVLLIDLDTQGNQADMLGVRERVYHPTTNPDGACISNLINDPDCAIHEFIISVDRREEGLNRPNLFLVPATNELSLATDNIAAIDSVNAYQASISRSRRAPVVKPQMDTLLSDRFARVKQTFDYIIIDCPPNLDTLKTAVYEFADEVIVPVKTDRLSAIGAQQHTDDILTMIRERGITVRISHIVPTMMQGRQILASQTVDWLKKRYGNLVSTPIPESVHVKESPAAEGRTLFEYAPDSKPAKAYNDLVRSVLNG